jgi:hypothetical protein
MLRVSTTNGANTPFPSLIFFITVCGLVGLVARGVDLNLSSRNSSRPLPPSPFIDDTQSPLICENCTNVVA